jgi:hypothetical protein
MLIVIASALLTALQASPSVPAASAPPPAKPLKEKKICRRDASTGSILPKTVCRTQNEWDDIDFANHNSAQFRRDTVSTTASPRPE